MSARSYCVAWRRESWDAYDERTALVATGIVRERDGRVLVNADRPIPADLREALTREAESRARGGGL